MIRPSRGFSRSPTCRGGPVWLLWAFSLPATFATAGGGADLELRSLAASCAACHGTEGHSAPNSSMRSLAHLPPAYFIARMRAFREDPTLASSVMAQIAKGYDDQQVKKLADYFANPP